MTIPFRRHPVARIKRQFSPWLTVCGTIAVLLVTTGSVMTPPETRRKLDFGSSAFKDGQPIPSQYTCDGKNISPPLTWKGAPGNTQSFVLIVDDPDSSTGLWTHWVLFNIGSEISDLPEDFAKSPLASGSVKEGVNGFKKVSYSGPCLTANKQHRYHFKLYALDITLNLQPGAARNDVEAAMAKHIVAIGQLMGTYQRK